MRNKVGKKKKTIKLEKRTISFLSLSLLSLLNKNDKMDLKFKKKN